MESLDIAVCAVGACYGFDLLAFPFVALGIAYIVDDGVGLSYEVVAVGPGALAEG